MTAQTAYQRLEAPICVQPLTSGQSNQTVRLLTPTQDCVLKRWQHGALFAMDRTLELTIQRRLAQHQLAPQVLDYDFEQGWFLQPYLSAPSLQSVELTPFEKVRAMAKTLATIHDTAIDIPAWSLANRVEHYLGQLREVDAAAAERMQRQLAPFRPLLDAWLTDPVLCHNDLSMNHIVMTCPVTVLDWEYAGLGHHLFDLASAIQINQLSGRLSQELIAAYEANRNASVDTVELAQWCQFVAWLNKLWQHLLQHAA